MEGKEIFNNVLRGLLFLAVATHVVVDYRDKKKHEHSDDNYADLIGTFLHNDTSDISTETVFKLREYPEYCDLSLNFLEDYEKDWQEGETKQEVQRTILFLKKDCQRFSAPATHQETTRVE